MYWEGEKECISREALRQLQLERLQATVLRVYMNVPFYRKKFDALGIDPDSFRSLEDVSRLPFTSKDDLRYLSCVKEAEKAACRDPFRRGAANAFNRAGVNGKAQAAVAR